MSHPDPATSTLYQLLSDKHGDSLWLADENIQAPLPPHNPLVQVVTNRHDLATALLRAGWPAQFSDFDLSQFDDQLFDRLLYRLSKEKPVVHHLINQSRRLLKTDGRLMLIGEKSEGIKTYARKARQYLGGTLQEQKLGADLWLCTLTTGSEPATAPLDDQDYTTLRPGPSQGTVHFLSKPGLYGWQKIDQGSARLIEALPELLGHPLPVQGSLLDLGCGFGYLTLCSAGIDTRIVCTDNNAAALLACRANIAQAGLNGDVVASDAGDCLSEQFDTILCNPPFHSGFSTSGDLTDKFLAAAARLLKPQGTACFVVNLHIPLERKAQKWFDQVQLHSDNGHFKLLSLRQPRRQPRG